MGGGGGGGGGEVYSLLRDDEGGTPPPRSPDTSVYCDSFSVDRCPLSSDVCLLFKPFCAFNGIVAGFCQLGFLVELVVIMGDK